jgi:hypothetical protein
LSILQPAAPFGLRSFGRFLVAGGANTAVGVARFPALYLALGGSLGYLPILVFCAVFNRAGRDQLRCHPVLRL